jgi:hypothetical protein
MICRCCICKSLDSLMRVSEWVYSCLLPIHLTILSIRVYKGNNTFEATLLIILASGRIGLRVFDASKPRVGYGWSELLLQWNSSQDPVEWSGSDPHSTPLHPQPTLSKPINMSWSVSRGVRNVRRGEEGRRGGQWPFISICFLRKERSRSELKLCLSIPSPLSRETRGELWETQTPFPHLHSQLRKPSSDRLPCNENIPSSRAASFSLRVIFSAVQFLTKYSTLKIYIRVINSCNRAEEHSASWNCL